MSMLLALLASQHITINLPAYELQLETIVDGERTVVEYPITIGRGHGQKPETPTGEGLVVSKRNEVTFRFANGDVIYWNRTFDERGRQLGYDLPYDKVRALGMSLPGPGYDYRRFIIHTNLDEFTLGAATSNGCVRLGMEDMQSLFDAVRPEQKMVEPNEELVNPVPLTIKYDVLELEGDTLELHANVYHKNIDYTQEFIDTLVEGGVDPSRYDAAKAAEVFSARQEYFHGIHEIMLDRLEAGYPNNYLEPEFKAEFHQTYSLDDFKK